MTDKTDILRVLRKLPDVLLVEPSRELVMQDEVHDRARALIAERGLAPDHPYIGWHAQASAFTGKGELRGVQRIYFGGDRAVVAAALAPLEGSGFAVLGGRHDGEAFALRRDARPAAVSVESLADWRTRLEVLGDELVAPLREGELRQLHELVAATELGELCEPVLRALRLRDELTAADLDTALSPDCRSKLGAETSAVIVHALDTDHPLARAAVAGLAAEGRADAAMLTAWGGPEALEAARVFALANPRRIPREYLALVAEAGDDPVAAGVALAEELRADAPETGDEIAGTVVSALTELYGDASLRSKAQLLRDERCPLWLRVVAVGQSISSPMDPAQAAAYRSHRPGDGLSPEERAEWLDLADEVLHEAGLPPSPGFDSASTLWQHRAVEQREFLIDRHLEGMRAALRGDAPGEPAVAVLLEILYGGGVLDAQTLDAATRDWRERLFVKPATYTPAAPAVVTLAVACSAAGHPMAHEIVQTVLGDERAWSAPHRMLLRAGLNWGPEADARAAKEFEDLANGGGDHSGTARHALARITARLRGVGQVLAACELAASCPQKPLYVPLGYASAAIGFASGGTGLYAHRFEDDSPRALRAALALADDDRLPVVARRHVLHLASDTKVLDRPLERRHAIMAADEIERLRETMSRIRARLGA